METAFSSRKSFPAAEVARAAGAVPLEWEAVASGGYGRVNAHWRVTLADERTAFVKHALTDDAVEWLRKERLVYESVRGPFMPTYLGAYDDGGIGAKNPSVRAKKCCPE